MRWLAICHSRLRHVGESPPIYGFEFVALLLTFPVFKLHNLLFKVAYTIRQRELRRLGRQCALLGGEDRSLQFDDLVLNHGSVTETYEALRDFHGRLQRAGQSGD